MPRPRSSPLKARKLLAEDLKFAAEQRKLIAEGRKLDRDRWLAPLVLLPSVLGGVIVAVRALKQRSAAVMVDQPNSPARAQ